MKTHDVEVIDGYYPSVRATLEDRLSNGWFMQGSISIIEDKGSKAFNQYSVVVSRLKDGINHG